ncbi:MAG: hypothetical protein D6759_16955 [Chloroflexi bacterium]|nr:MAG: hypothetical protein D6759_16955 [Chloroflexota bacterium]
MSSNPLKLKPEALLELALQTRPPSEILLDYGVPPSKIPQLLQDPTFVRLVEQEKKRLEESDDLDAYYNRLCYRMLRNKLVALALEKRIEVKELIQTVEMLRKHAKMDDRQETTVHQGQQPVLNIIISSQPQDPSKGQTITISAQEALDGPED